MVDSTPAVVRGAVGAAARSARCSGRLRSLSVIRVAMKPGSSTDTPTPASLGVQVEGQHLRQRDHAHLRHRVAGQPADGQHARHRGRVHDVAALALLQQPGHEGPHAVDHAPEVDAEHPSPVVERERPGRPPRPRRRRCCTRRGPRRTRRSWHAASPSTSSQRETSATTWWTSWPPSRSSAVACSSRARSTSDRTTRMPSAANRCAMASPMPLAAPVTTATRPLSSSTATRRA